MLSAARALITKGDAICSAPAAAAVFRIVRRFTGRVMIRLAIAGSSPGVFPLLFNVFYARDDSELSARLRCAIRSRPAIFGRALIAITERKYKILYLRSHMRAAGILVLLILGCHAGRIQS